MHCQNLGYFLGCRGSGKACSAIKHCASHLCYKLLSPIISIWDFLSMVFSKREKKTCYSSILDLIHFACYGYQDNVHIFPYYIPEQIASIPAFLHGTRIISSKEFGVSDTVQTSHYSGSCWRRVWALLLKHLRVSTSPIYPKDWLQEEML